MTGLLATAQKLQTEDAVKTILWSAYELFYGVPCFQWLKKKKKKSESMAFTWILSLRLFHSALWVLPCHKPLVIHWNDRKMLLWCGISIVLLSECHFPSLFLRATQDTGKTWINPIQQYLLSSTCVIIQHIFFNLINIQNRTAFFIWRHGGCVSP